MIAHFRQKVQCVFLSQAKQFMLTFTSFFWSYRRAAHRGVHRRGSRGCAADHYSSCRWQAAALPVASWTKRAKLILPQPRSTAEAVTETTRLWFVFQKRLIELFRIRLSSAVESRDRTQIVFLCSQQSEDRCHQRHSGHSEGSLAGRRLVHPMGWTGVIRPSSPSPCFPCRLVFRQGAERRGGKRVTFIPGEEMAFLGQHLFPWKSLLNTAESPTERGKRSTASKTNG